MDDGKEGAKGDTGILVSTTEPTEPYIGMLWQSATGEPIKRWDGTKWVIHGFSVENIIVATLSALSADLGNITAGIIKSGNYVADQTGLMIDANKGIIDSKPFKLGATSQIGGWNIGEGGLYNDHVGNGKAGFISRADSNIVFYVGTRTFAQIIQSIIDGDDTYPEFAVGTDGSIFAKNLYCGNDLQAETGYIWDFSSAGMEYKTTEVKTGEKWLGKPLYRKVIDVGAISSATKAVNHGVANVADIWVDLANSWLKASNGGTYMIPRTEPNIANNISTVAVSVNPTGIVVSAGSNANFTQCYVTIKYTKK